MELPKIRIESSFFAVDRCAVCGREWEPAGPDPSDAAVPAAYTVESLKEENVRYKPPQVVCDLCVQKHYPETFDELLEERQRFWRE